MLKNRLPLINLGIGALAALLLIVAVFNYVSRPEQVVMQETFERQWKLPKRSFAMPKEDYEAIGPPFVTLPFSPATMQLPDLRRHLIYYGKNDRPDADDQEPYLHFGFGREQGSATVKAKNPLYLVYRDDKYIFSPDNEETTLWIVPTPKGDQDVIVAVLMRGEQGQIINKPAGNAQFNLKKKRLPRFGDLAKWEIGGNRVDASLLARQKARWYGLDRFLEKHGGPEYKSQAVKERIDFGEGAERYSVYVGEKEPLIWKDERWQPIYPEVDSQKYPLMMVTGIDNRLMSFELWDVGGKGQVKIRILKSAEAWSPKRILADFKFLGARTRTQFVFEIGDERLLLSPQDWLLRTDDGWKKLTTVEEIDDYVDRKEVGVLFILDGVRRISGRQMLTGTLFNSTRTALQLVELPMQQGGGKFVAREEEEDDDEDDDEDDEDDDDDEELPFRGRRSPFDDLQGDVDEEEMRHMLRKFGGAR